MDTASRGGLADVSVPDKTRLASIMIVDGRGQWKLSGLLHDELAVHKCEADISEKNDLQGALYQLERTSAIGVVIVNLLFPAGVEGTHTHEPDGLTVVRAVRNQERTPSGGERTTLVVALRQTSDIYPDLEQEALDAGADLVLEWSNIGPRNWYGGLKQLAKWIHDELTRKGLIMALPHLAKDDEPGVLTALSDIGEANVSLLISDLAATVGDVDEAALKYVTPGASGAHVLRAKLTLSDGTARTWLIKFAKDADVLKAELHNSQNVAGAYALHLIVEYLPYGPISHGDWHAIAMVFASEATTLREWLCDPGAADHVADVLSGLFLDRGLADLYQNRRGGPPVPAIDGLRLPSYRRLRVRSTVAELKALLSEDRAMELDEVPTILRTIAAFVRSGQIADVVVDRRYGALEIVPQHGDLHGGNVLVLQGRHPRPCVIDLAAYGWQHWALDVARLVVDIVMHCLDPSPESHFWDRWSFWRAVLLAASSFELAEDDAKNRAALAALRWVGARRSELLPLMTDKRRWEWHVALAEQLLRSACQHQLPTPKRVLGLVGAYDQLQLALATMPEPPETY
jgi:hypothetical protein